MEIGNGKRNDQGAAHVSQENQDHQHGQRSPHERLVLQVGDRVADIGGLVEKLQHDHARGEHLLNLRHGLADAIHHFDGIGPRCFLHGQGNRRLAVHPDDVGLVPEVIDDFADIPDVDRPLLHVRDDDILDGFDQAELGFGEEAVVIRAGLDVPRGDDQVGLLDRLDDGLRGQVEGPEALPVETDADLTNFPPPTRAEATLETCSISGSTTL